MIDTIRNFFTPPVFERDEDKSRTAGVLYRILIVTYILLPITILVQIINPELGRFYLPIALATTVLSTVLLAVTRHGYVRPASMILITSFMILSMVVDLFSNGETRPINTLSAAVIVAGGLLLGPRGAFVTAAMYGVKRVLVLILIHNQLITLTTISPAPTPVIDGITTFIVYIIIAIVFSLASNSMYAALVRARQSENELAISNRQLQELTQNLENRIRERTLDLESAGMLSEKRARQFEAIAHISSAIASIQNIQELLPRISEVISQQMGFYHVGIFLTAPQSEYAVLSAANSDGGKKMIQRHHQLKIGEQGIVGYVTQTGKPRIALDVGEDAHYFTNPELPSTHSEMALPLKSGTEVIGALDIQSTEIGAFSDEDFRILSTLADQVSLAIQNARLFDQTQKTLSEFEAIQRQYVRETWGHLPKAENLGGYRYSVTGVVPLSEMELGTDENMSQTRRETSVPIIMRGETIGTLVVQTPKNESISTDQMDLIKAVAERVAISAENARLFDETIRRAEREHLVSDITTKIRSTTDPQEMVKTAVEELKRALGVTRVEIVPKKIAPPPDK
jgi:GAF domain-containing protein